MRKRLATRGQHSLEHLQHGKESKTPLLVRRQKDRSPESQENPEIQVATRFADQTMGLLSYLRERRKK
jgi:hypothetical protein